MQMVMGYPLDCGGYDFAPLNLNPKNLSDAQKVSGFIADRGLGQPLVNVGNSHGHFLASLAGAEFTSAGVEIIAVKMRNDLTLEANETYDQNLILQNTKILSLDDRLARSIDYSIKQGAQVINISITWVNHSGLPSDSLLKSLNEAKKKNILIFSAADNWSTTFAKCPLYIRRRYLHRRFRARRQSGPKLLKFWLSSRAICSRH
jgi:hypothetical protein